MSDNIPTNSAGKIVPEHIEYSNEDEIDLIELVKPLWQQKILIAGITLLTIVIAVVLIFRVTPQYIISTQLKPGTFRWDSKNNPISYLQPSDLQSILTGGSFSDYIAKSGFAGKEPALTATTSKNRKGNQITAYFFWPDREEGKKLLSGFVDFLNNPNNVSNKKKLSGLQIQRLSLGKSIKTTQEMIKARETEKQKVKLNIEQKKEKLKLVNLQVNKLNREIDRISADLALAKKEAEFLDEKNTVTEETKPGYEKSRQEIDENTTKIIALRDKLLSSPPDDSLQLLLLASIIQQNISYLNTIEQKIANARKEIIANHKAKEQLLRKQENCRLKIADLQDKIVLEIPNKKADIQKSITILQMAINQEIPSKIFLLNQKIDEIRDKINTISLIEIVKAPRASLKPEKPKKRKIIVLAGIVGLFLAIVIAYIRHFIRTAAFKPS